MVEHLDIEELEDMGDIEVTCAICGKKVKIGKTHKDYKRLVKDRKGVFICDQCQTRLQFEAQELQKKPFKPM